MNAQKFAEHFQLYNSQAAAAGRPLAFVKDQVAVLDEDTAAHTPREYDWSYLLHCGWAARVLAKNKTQRHADFGSYVYFAALCSAWIPQFHFFDIRGLHCPLPGLGTGIADLTRLPFADEEWESISCLHVLEHVGLGRYGDTVDADGDKKAIREMWRVLKPGGALILVLPMNRDPRVNFNAHRIYSLDQVWEFCHGQACYEKAFLHAEEIKDKPPLEGDFTGCFEFVK